MERIALTVEQRPAGKGLSRRLRTSGKVPGVLYGKSVAPLPIAVDRVSLEKIVSGKSGMNVLLDLQVKDGDSGLALIRDYQADPFRREFWHVDLQAVSLNEKINVEVPVELVGRAIGVKEGGVLEQARRTILVKTVPDYVPTTIPIDISALKIGDSIHMQQVSLPENVELANKNNYTVISVIPPIKMTESAVAAAAAATTDGAAPAAAAPAAADKEKKA